MADQQSFRSAPANLPGGSRRHSTWIDAVEIASGREDIGPTSAGRTRGTGRNEPAVQSGEEAAHFRLGTGRYQSLIQRLMGAVIALSEHVQPVTDPHLLDIAQPGIEFDQGRLCIFAGRDARLRCQTSLSGARHYEFGQLRGAARVERLRLGIFVEQVFQRSRGTVCPGRHQRWCEMSDGHCRYATFRLRGFAGIVDDERVYERHRPQNRARGTAFR
jgi:hypothetical protein